MESGLLHRCHVAQGPRQPGGSGGPQGRTTAARNPVACETKQWTAVLDEVGENEWADDNDKHEETKERERQKVTQGKERSGRQENYIKRTSDMRKTVSGLKQTSPEWVGGSLGY